MFRFRVHGRVAGEDDAAGRADFGGRNAPRLIASHRTEQDEDWSHNSRLPIYSPSAAPLVAPDRNSIVEVFGLNKVLLTGAAGFLGSHLADALLARGSEVTGLDNLSQGNLENLRLASGSPGFALLQGDVRDPNAVEQAAEGMDTIIHLAAYKIPRYGGRLNTLDINTTGTRNVLDAARKVGARVLFASTSDCYGKNPEVPFSEEHDSVFGPPGVARWAYAISKSFSEHLCLAYAEEFGVPVTILRYFGAFGPRHHLSWWGGPQSVFISLALEGKPLTVHGDGTQTRSFTYVSDTIAGTIAVLAADLDRTRGNVFNVGSQEEVSIRDLAEAIWNAVRPGSKPALEFVPYASFSAARYEDVMRRIPDLTKISALGWRPRVSLKEGL
ncbi:MAG: NAD-dependent epimerase/dehydratase family protein, partial [Chloroflexi bacterium]|nr:NAD-dependent epimerase/dehydratase family protein [Chloroflexota bacterium]